jgi:hypothetical protein
MARPAVGAHHRAAGATGTVTDAAAPEATPGTATTAATAAADDCTPGVTSEAGAAGTARVAPRGSPRATIGPHRLREDRVEDERAGQRGGTQQRRATPAARFETTQIHPQFPISPPAADAAPAMLPKVDGRGCQPLEGLLAKIPVVMESGHTPLARRGLAGEAPLCAASVAKGVANPREPALPLACWFGG